MVFISKSLFSGTNNLNASTILFSVKTLFLVVSLIDRSLIKTSFSTYLTSGSLSYLDRLSKNSFDQSEMVPIIRTQNSAFSTSDPNLNSYTSSFYKDPATGKFASFGSHGSSVYYGSILFDTVIKRYGILKPCAEGFLCVFDGYDFYLRSSPVTSSNAEGYENIPTSSSHSDFDAISRNFSDELSGVSVDEVLIEYSPKLRNKSNIYAIGT